MKKTKIRNYWNFDLFFVFLNIASLFLNYTTITQPGCDNDIIIINEQDNFSHLRLNEYVFYIEYYNKGCYIYTKKTDNHNIIYIYQSKYVVSTISTGVYQNKIIEFYPKLPFWKQRALYELPMVNYVPFYIQNKAMFQKK